MKLEKIISLANEPVRLRFMAMERSLRATGCDLPLLVIPYDDRLFDLPKNASWWTTGIRDWLKVESAHPMMYKYQCLNTSNYQYVDTDIIFLRDPSSVLAPHDGFISSCGHWHNPQETINSSSLPILKAKSTCWQRNVFNAGQFACDQMLYTEELLKSTSHDPRYTETCLRFPYHDQPGLVLLASLSGVPIHNLTLPPTNMESTWAGDYVEEGYEKNYWSDEARKPYLIHWAGCTMWEPRAVDKLFTYYLTAAELKEWNEEVEANKLKKKKAMKSLRHRLRNVARGVKVMTGKS